jgi:hypothetical protein
VFVRWRRSQASLPASAELWAVRPDGSGAQRLAEQLDLPDGFHHGLGYYGAFGWQRLFAIAPR